MYMSQRNDEHSEQKDIDYLLIFTVLHLRTPVLTALTLLSLCPSRQVNWFKACSIAYNFWMNAQSETIKY